MARKRAKEERKQRDGCFFFFLSIFFGFKRGGETLVWSWGLEKKAPKGIKGEEKNIVLVIKGRVEFWSCEEEGEGF